MIVSGVPGSAVDAHRADLEPYLREFTNRGQVTTDDLADDIASGERQCWLVHDHRIRAVALTQVFDDRKKICRITHVTGSGFREWQDAFREIEQWAHHIGCDRIEALARPGWERIGKQYGLRKTHVMLEKSLG